MFREAEEFVTSLANAGRTVLFVGTKRQAKDVVAEEAVRCGMYFVNERWLGGLLTNFATIQRSLGRLRKCVAEQAGAIRRWRRLKLSVVLEQAGHAGQMSAAAAAPWCVTNVRWETGCATRAETHCGCFLPDLTGLARRPSAADLPGSAYHAFGGRGQGGKLR